MDTQTAPSIHQFTVKDIKGNPQSLAQYKGKVLLIVNTASECGFTPQLEEMEDLYREFRTQGLEILAFPSNDFAGQEPLDGEAIEQFCMTRYEASYPIFDKVSVVGTNACDLFQFLAERKKNGRLSSRPRWNFHKYLVDQEGKVVDYFYSFTSPSAGRVKKRIEQLLKDN